jgi:cell division septation protein DedD
MHGTKKGIEIKGNIEIVLLILIVVLAAVSALSFYVQKEPQKTNQEIPLIKPTPPPSVNKASVSLKKVQLPTQRQETKTTLQGKMNPTAEPVVPAVQRDPQIANQAMPLIKHPPTSSVNQANAPMKTVQPPTQLQETKMPSTEKETPAAKSFALAVQKITKEPMPSEQKTAETLPKNPHKVAETEKTINPSVYSIKVGSFKSRENADRIWKYLKKNGYEPSLETVTLNDNSTWYRVTAGQFKTQEEAADCAKNMEEKEKIKTVIVKKN